MALVVATMADRPDSQHGSFSPTGHNPDGTLLILIEIPRMALVVATMVVLEGT